MKKTSLLAFLFLSFCAPTGLVPAIAQEAPPVTAAPAQCIFNMLDLMGAMEGKKQALVKLNDAQKKLAVETFGDPAVPNYDLYLQTDTEAGQSRLLVAVGDCFIAGTSAAPTMYVEAIFGSVREEKAQRGLNG